MKVLGQFLGFLLKIFANAWGFLLTRIPHFAFLWHIKVFAFLMNALDSRRYQNALTNLNFIYGDEMSEVEKKAIIKRCYENFAFVLLESVRVPFIPLEKHTKRFSFIDESYILDTLAKDKGAVLVSAHYGYWEAMASVLPPRYQWCKMASLGRLTAFEAINQMIIARREVQNVKFIDKKGAFKHLLKLYSESNALCGILIDQNIAESEGVWVNFFGKRATQSSIASILSRRFNVGIVPVMISTNEDFSHFEVRFYAPIYCEKSEDSTKDILTATQKQADVLQEAIARNPRDWFWFHKRWKAAYKDIYEI